LSEGYLALTRRTNQTEVDADLLDDFEGQTDMEVVAPGMPLVFLSGGIAYLREEEPGTICPE
jgi:hypothetical protein